MGLAAGQARLLSITARLTDNEQNGQALSFAKQRLADETDQINKAYNEALSSTKLTVLTGFNGAEPQYEDISYGLMTGYNTVAAGKQYVVTDAKGKILVNDKLAKAFKDGNGDFNYFLAHVDDVTSGQTVNYSQCDLDLSVRQSEANIKAVHEAWDKYLTSVGIYFGDKEHDYDNDNVTYSWNTSGEYQYPQADLKLRVAEFKNTKEDGVIRINDLAENATYRMVQGVVNNTPEFVTNNDGEQVPVYYIKTNDINGVTKTYKIYRGEKDSGVYYAFRKNGSGWDHYYNRPIYPDNVKLSISDRANEKVTCPISFEGTTEEQRDLYDYAVAITKEVYTTPPSDSDIKTISDDPEVASKIKYYRNIFNQMAKFGYTTAAEMKIPVNGLNLELANNNRLLNDNNWFEQFLRQGKVQLKAFDSIKKDFIATTFDQDSSIQEVADERKIAKAEAQFTEAQDALERKDKKIDLELKKLDTEHNALQTEYESLKEVVKKNVEKSFNIFS